MVLRQRRPQVGRIVSFVISLVVQAGLISLLLFLGQTSPAPQTPRERSITVVSVAAAPAPLATPAPPVWREVPIVPSVEAPVLTLEPPAPATASAAAQGLASTPSDDPYAFASYRPPTPPSVGTTGSTLRARPDALEKLEGLLRAKLGNTTRQISLHLLIDPWGRIEAIDAMPAQTDPDTATIREIALGYSLCDPDPARAPKADVVLSLNTKSNANSINSPSG